MRQLMIFSVYPQLWSTLYFNTSCSEIANVTKKIWKKFTHIVFACKHLMKAVSMCISVMWKKKLDLCMFSRFNNNLRLIKTLCHKSEEKKVYGYFCLCMSFSWGSRPWCIYMIHVWIISDHGPLGLQWLIDWLMVCNGISKRFCILSDWISICRLDRLSWWTTLIASQGKWSCCMGSYFVPFLTKEVIFTFLLS